MRLRARLQHTPLRLELSRNCILLVLGRIFLPVGGHAHVLRSFGRRLRRFLGNRHILLHGSTSGLFV